MPKSDSDPTDLAPDEVETLALRWRAETAFIPYRIWVALSPASRKRLEALSQTAAQRLIATRPLPRRDSECDPDLPRPQLIDDLAIEPLRHLTRPK